MARKTLLNESEIRRFMKLASINPLKEGSYMPGNRDKEKDMEEGMRPKDDDMDEGMRPKDDDMDEGMRLKDDDMDEGLFEQEDEEVVDMDMAPMDEPAMDDMDDMGGAGDSAQEKALERVLDAIMDLVDASGGEVDMNVEIEDEDGDDEKMRGDDVAGVEGGDSDDPVAAPEDKEMMNDMQVMDEEEEIVAEVARRVANRLLKEKKTEAMANKLAESIFRRMSSK